MDCASIYLVNGAAVQVLWILQAPVEVQVMRPPETNF